MADAKTEEDKETEMRKLFRERMELAKKVAEEVLHRSLHEDVLQVYDRLTSFAWMQKDRL